MYTKTGIQHIPEYYEKYPELLNFLSAQKMPWKESKTLTGEIGEYIVTMQQASDEVYLVVLPQTKRNAYFRFQWRFYLQVLLWLKL